MPYRLHYVNNAFKGPLPARLTLIIINGPFNIVRYIVMQPFDCLLAVAELEIAHASSS